MIPNTSVTKNPFALPSLPQSQNGIAAYVAAALAGAMLVPQIFNNPNTVASSFEGGPLVEYAAYHMGASNKPIIGMRSNPSVAAMYGSITTGGLGTGGIQQGTFTVTATGSTFPLENYGVIITFVAPGTLGSAGITYTYSLDRGNSTSAPIALGTGLVIAIPNSNVSFTLATTGTGTVVAGDFFVCYTQRALNSDSDNAAAMAALSLTRLPWEGVFLDSNFGSASVAVVDGVLATLEGQGQFKFGVLNTPWKQEPEPTAETESAYATRIAALLGQQTSERMCVGADGGHVSSTVTGLNLKRPTALALMAMTMTLTPNIGTDPAYVANGPATGFIVSDSNSNPLDHDEGVNPTLDLYGFTTLRTFAAGGPAGVYITNANIISPSNSNIRYLQQLRVLNQACTIVYSLLTNRLSLGVNVELNTQSQTLVIQEADAQQIEQWVNPQLQSGLKGQVSTVNGQPGAALTLSRTDNLGITPAIVTATVQVVGKAYIKGFLVTVAFSKTISAPTS